MNKAVMFYTLLLCIGAAILFSRGSFITAIAIIFASIAVMTWFDEVCRAVRGKQ